MGATERRKATAPAFYEGRRVRVGDVVAVPAGFEALWLGEPLPSADEKKQKPADDGKKS